jgi:hypothetical protein
VLPAGGVGSETAAHRRERWQSVSDNAHIPEWISMPDRVSTRVGDLEFFDSTPSGVTTATTLDHQTFPRGVEVFLNTEQVASLEAERVGPVEVGATAANEVDIVDDLVDSKSFLLASA